MTNRINELARRQILYASDQALQAADTFGVVPTPLSVVAEANGVLALVDISELPDDLDLMPKLSRPQRVKKWLGAYLYKADVAFVDYSQPEGRARFTEAHELGHRVIPWHRGAFADDERSLFKDTEDTLELEANLAAAHLIFQGRPFFERAADYPLSLRTPLLLAQEFRASLHATIRYYVEHHAEPLAVVVAGRFARQDGTVPIFLAVESPRFREQFGPIIGRFPSLSLPVDDRRPIGPLLQAARDTAEPPQATVSLLDLNGARKRFVAEAFFNQRTFFLTLAPTARLRSGRRIAVVAG